MKNSLPRQGGYSAPVFTHIYIVEKYNTSNENDGHLKTPSCHTSLAVSLCLSSRDSCVRM